MDITTHLSSLAHEDLPLLDYAVEEAIIHCLESICPRSRAQLDPEPSPPSPCSAELKPEPTAHGEPVPGAINEPSTDLKIAPEPKSLGSPVQVCEPSGLMVSLTPLIILNSCPASLSHYLCPPASPPVQLSVSPVSAKEAVCELSICPKLSTCITTTTE
ncbi:hypothetical protein M9458_019375, partial [Cirrhinus mrigala]